jgi:hypothetical protein
MAKDQRRVSAGGSNGDERVQAVESKLFHKMGGEGEKKKGTSIRFLVAES